jgi:hypothetical protein
MTHIYLTVLLPSIGLPTGCAHNRSIERTHGEMHQAAPERSAQVDVHQGERLSPRRDSGPPNRLRPAPLSRRPSHTPTRRKVERPTICSTEGPTQWTESMLAARCRGPPCRKAAVTNLYHWPCPASTALICACV